MPSGQTPLGNGWDHSYNIYIEVPAVLTGGPPIVIHDGNARPAVFTDDGNGTWTAPRYHRSGKFDGNGQFVLTFADGGQWIFRSAQESATSEIRKLWRIIDRNGNIVELEYDNNDRLERVVNSVGQSLELEYDANDHIEAVEAVLDEETERRVTYEYYGPSDPDGNEFDLKSVTLPEIDGTVTNNDFPNGIATTYTYSTGSMVAELNGNLLTIEDGLNQVYLRNTYATTTNPADYEFDRLVSQAWGESDELITLTYAAVTPSVGNGFAVTKAWVNDRVGRVSEHFFDEHNQLVLLREYTGFADPEEPTDDNNNQPTGKLRSTDPAYFSTRYNYNVDGHVSHVVYPRGNTVQSVYEVDINPNASPQTRGNLREVHRQGGTCSSSFVPLSEYYEYEPGFGNEHDERNFVTEATDAEGNVTEFEYDSAGNRTAIIHPEPDTREDMEYNALGQLTLHRLPEDQHSHRREIEYTYANDGRLRETIVDPEGLALTTTSEYDVACNEIRREDARGHDKLYTYNEHNQLIREQGPLETCSAACGGGTPTRAYTDRIYDANMNLVRVDYEALDCDGSAQSNEVISTTFEYDILNEDTITRVEISPMQEIVTEVELDANREVVRQLYGEATAENDLNNTVTTIYDERGLVFREIRGKGSAGQSTIEHDYDLNGNEVALLVGLEGPTRTTTHTYDCADRLVTTTDPMGNVTEYEYDKVGNIVEQSLYGELVDVSGSTSNILLERVTNEYDTMNRLVATIQDHFDPVTKDPIGDGESITTYMYDGESRPILIKNASGYSTHDYDAAGRPLKTVDPEGNIVEFTYDANGNVLSRIFTDVPSISGSPQVGTWEYVYDARNNLIETEDPMGSTWHYCYDSLGLLAEEIDPRGNRTLHAYDGAGRLLETNYVLTDDGTGSGMVVGTVVTRQAWDDSDRLIEREDPNGNVTEYTYDSLNRLTTETFADNSAITFEYDVHDNVLVREDPNGTILTMTYDGLERLVEVEVDAGTGVNGSTTYESYAYEGRSLLVAAADNDSEVERTHDSLGAILSETQTYSPHISLLPYTPYTVSYERDGVGNAVKTTYPAGRVIERSFDGLRRTKRIDEDSTQLVELDYLGPSLLRRTYLEVDTRSDYEYDLARRMISSEHADSIGPTLFDVREYTYDGSGNKQSEEDLSTGTPTGLRVMTHDSLGRMIESDVSGSASTDRTVEYQFDDAGNRSNVTGDACAGAYDLTGNDVLLNQYTETPCEAWTHDTAGNLLESEASAAAGLDREFEYDHRGRLVQAWVDRGTLDEVRLLFAYDALGRKIHTMRIDFSTIEGEQYIYDGGNVIEEYPDGEVEPSATYLYGDDLDDRLQMLSDESWWYYDDELGSMSAVGYRDGSTLVLERYAYQDYGEPVVLASAGSRNPYLFAGSRWFGDVRLYDMRTRHFDPMAGRFISRDSIGIWGDEENLGNGYVYVSNAPDTFTDPTGEAKKPSIKNCHSGAADDVQDSLEEAERAARRADKWFETERKHSRKKRKKRWQRNEHDGQQWWGKYNSARFKRIGNNYGKIVRRCSKNVIKFKCRSTGSKCGRSSKTVVAWTHSSWHSTIRLCKNSWDGFFEEDGKLRYEIRATHKALAGVQTHSSTVLVHEIAHNINAIGDKMSTWDWNMKGFAKRKPAVASWSARHYEYFAGTRW